MGAPIKVLLIGDGWDLLNPVLASLAATGDLSFRGPYPPGLHAESEESGPLVIVMGPGTQWSTSSLDPGQIESDAELPAVLVCVGHGELESNELYGYADDFVLVPCTPAELEKRIKRLAAKRREAEASSRIQVGKIALDLATYQVFLEGQRIDLAWLEYQLLKFLMENLGRIFTREQLLAHVWGVADFGGTRTVDVHIRRLRNKLEIYGDQYFRTVKNVGYGMVRPVQT